MSTPTQPHRPHSLPTRPLKSTAPQYAFPGAGTPPAPSGPPPLPPGWTEHKAPTGHSYFYHSATKTSTYTRPVASAPAHIPQQQQQQQQQHHHHQHHHHHQPTHASPTQFPFAAAVLSGAQFPGAPFTHGVSSPYPHHPHQFPPRGRGRGGIGGGGRPYQPPAKPDRPKKKRSIPGAAPWVLVRTKLGREFVHNLETKESLWMHKGEVPEEVMKGVEMIRGMSQEELGRLDAEERKAREIRKAQRAREREKGKENAIMKDAREGGGEEGRFEEGEEEEEEDDEHEEEAEGSRSREGRVGAEGGEPRGSKRSASAAALGDGGEEGEGSDEEGEGEYYEEGDDDYSDSEAPSRPRWDGGNSNSAPTGPIEFTEDDIAWQLSAMAEEYGLVEEDLEATEDLPASEAIHIFTELLDEIDPNPYTTWENTYPSLADDPRYTVLTTSKQRQEVFTQWCKSRIAILKEEKAKQDKKDPRVLYLEFLAAHVKEVKKLYWTEFKRKFKKEKEMKDAKLAEKDREKIYREFAGHVKLSPALLENELRKLLKGNRDLTRNTSMDRLPLSVITDVRYAAYPVTFPSEGEKAPQLPPRDEVVKKYLGTLPEEVVQISEKEVKERQREEALRGRERAVMRDKGRLRGEIERGREMLRGEEMEIERAVREVGRRGLMNSIEAEREREKEKAGGSGGGISGGGSGEGVK